ncbi:MAG TPA: Gfo/Idh/MocA family oxidoreductase, partial [Gemmata sp.]|nr:Gfo/Idh/MocA family oxidoreductase [Gemmata sp.]
MTARITRRRAIQLGTVGTLGHMLTAPAISAARILGASEKLRVAGIGVGGKGSGDIEQAGKFLEVVALCDIDEQRLGKRAETWPTAKKYFDYRKLFDEMAKEIDAVTVSTADHHHAPASIRAMKL